MSNDITKLKSDHFFGNRIKRQNINKVLSSRK